MPYIKDKMIRKILDTFVGVFLRRFKIHGNLNYFLFKLCKEVIKKEGESYGHYKEFIGELEMCKLEIYRQLVSKYEDSKIKDNGDVN